MSSRRFYNSNLKNVKILGSAYRTYLFNNVVSVRICDYDYGSSFEDIVDLGIED
jgi:tRNA(Glu) U13 pseudouridine synthase TruD